MARLVDVSEQQKLLALSKSEATTVLQMLVSQLAGTVGDVKQIQQATGRCPHVWISLDGQSVQLSLTVEENQEN